MAGAYRQLVSPVQVQVGLPDSGAAALDEQLAAATRRVAQDTFDLGSAMTREQGAQAGAAAGAAGKPDPRTGFDAITPYGAAYNTAAEAAYSSKIQADIGNTADRLALEHEGDPQGFVNAMQGFAVQVYDGVPEAYRPGVKLMLDAKVGAHVNNLRVQQKAQVDDQNRAAYLEGADAAVQTTLDAAIALPREQADAALAAAVRDNQKKLDALVASHALRAEEAVKLADAFHAALDKGLTNGRVDLFSQKIGAVLKVDVPRAAQDLAAVDANPDLSPAEKDEIHKRYDEDLSRLHTARAQLYAEDTARLNELIASGSDSMEIVSQANRLFKVGALTVDGLEAARAARVRNAKENADKGAKIQAVQEILSQGGALDPRDEAARKAVSLLFDSSMANAGYKPGDPNWQAGAIEMLRRSNIMPASAESWMRINGLSQDPAKASLAAEFYAKMKQANPYAFPYTVADPNLESRLSQIYEGRTIGADPLTLIPQVDKNLSLPKERRDFLEEKFKKEKVQDQNARVLAKFVSGDDRFSPHWYSGTPAIPLEMQAEYNRLVQQNYMLNGGNAPSAQKQAAEQVMNVYRMTDINGKPEIMKWAPQLPTDVIREDINRKLQGRDLTGQYNTPLTPEEQKGFEAWRQTLPERLRSSYDYDLQGFYKEVGAKPFSGDMHMPDTYKKPNHETFSNESKYAVGADKAVAGHWEGEGQNAKYVPAQIRMVPTPATDYTHGKVWGLVPVDADGFIYDVIRDTDNRPLVYYMPGTENFQAAEARVRERTVQQLQAEAEQRKAREQAVKEGLPDYFTKYPVH